MTYKWKIKSESEKCISTKCFSFLRYINPSTCIFIFLADSLHCDCSVQVCQWDYRPSQCCKLLIIIIFFKVNGYKFWGDLGIFPLSNHCKECSDSLEEAKKKMEKLIKLLIIKVIHERNKFRHVLEMKKPFCYCILIFKFYFSFPSMTSRTEETELIRSNSILSNLHPVRERYHGDWEKTLHCSAREGTLKVSRGSLQQV